MSDELGLDKRFQFILSATIETTNSQFWDELKLQLKQT